ncbi:MAG: FAD:protein FMN transferase [Rhodobacteraceae bacterium]|nr:FAD:protein FMN transferase [Paracoccaceae bacterium]
MTRRRFLTISAAVAGVGLGGGAASASARWTGRAMGAATSMQLAGFSDAEARPVFRAVERELARLERIFSLYRSDSQLVQLNRSAVLMAPAPEMLELLSLCGRLHNASAGAFDPTLQPLWQLYAASVSEDAAPAAGALRAAETLVGWQKVRYDRNAVRLNPGMALTLNGVAQGYITDRVAALLRARGLRDVLIDMGEVSAMGQRADGRDWKAGIALPDGTLVDRVTLRDRALATSSPQGTVLDAREGVGHIIDPRRISRRPERQLISVSASSAAIADGLSTAGCLLSEAELSNALIVFPGTTLETII